MTPIERTHEGALIFLACGCAVFRLRSHPTGTAFLVKIWKTCDEHSTESQHFWSIPKGELVSSYQRAS